MFGIKRKIEILAPAGSYEAMMAAMNAGCDGVYIGGSMFGARANAKNLEEESLIEASHQVHLRNKKIYLTVNTLVKEKEMQDFLFDFLKEPYQKGLDAVIVQDFGVMRFIHKNFPQLPIHASTQATINMGQAVEKLRKYGVTRLVTPRELSLDEIANIRENTDLEIETFVHGALCYSYSGQCLMSSFIGGRSGNRGLCAQPCRMKYEFNVDGEVLSNPNKPYLLSPKDISCLKYLDEMIEAGVSSLKIEGRMKSPEYTAIVVSIYRKYVDLYYKLGKEEYKKIVNEENSEFIKDIGALQDVYSRGEFSEGYLKQAKGEGMMAMERPNHSGTLVGRVSGIENNQIIMDIYKDLNAQDVLEVRYHNDSHYEFTLKNDIEAGGTIKTNISQRKLANRELTKRNIFHGGLVQIGDMIYRTRNNKLLDWAHDTYIKDNQKIILHGKIIAKKEKKLEFIISKGTHSIKVFHKEVEKAINMPLSKARINQQLNKTGKTEFIFEDIIVDMDHDIFIPMGNLSEIKRQGLELIKKKIVESYYRPLDKKDDELIKYKNIKNKEEKQKMGIVASIQTIDQWDLVLNMEEIGAIYLDLEAFSFKGVLALLDGVNNTDKDIYIILPHICRKQVYEDLKKNKLPSLDKLVKGYIVKNLEEVELLKHIKTKKEIILDHNLYTFNKESYKFWQDDGIRRFTAPLELDYKELKDLTIYNSDIIVYGHMPAMISTQCLYKNTQVCQKNNLVFEKQNAYIINQKEEKFMVQAYCDTCYNIIYHHEALSLIRDKEKIKRLKPLNIRLHFTVESGKKTEKILKNFIKEFGE